MAGRALLAQLVEHLHGKEGVSGSSPEEGSGPTIPRVVVTSGEAALPPRRLRPRRAPGPPASAKSASRNGRANSPATASVAPSSAPTLHRVVRRRDG